MNSDLLAVQGLFLLCAQVPGRCCCLCCSVCRPGLACLRLRKRAGVPILFQAVLGFGQWEPPVVTGVWVRVVGRAGPGKEELRHWAARSPPAPDELPAAPRRAPWQSWPPSLLGSSAHRGAMLHRRRLRDPEPVGRGLMGPSPWWDLSPALTMRLHLLASLSGGGLAWRPGDRRWLAGEGQVWWAVGARTVGR